MKKLTLILSAFLLAISLSAQERVHAVTDAGITFKVQGKGGTYTKPLPERVTIAEDAKTEWDGETLTLTVTTPQVDENEEPTDPLVVEYVLTEQEIDAAWAYVPTPEPVIGEWTSLEFFSRFTQSEQIAIESSTAITVRLVKTQFLASQEIIANDPRTILGMEALVAAEVITEQRKDEILTAE